MSTRRSTDRTKPTKREVAIAKARIAGYANDTRTFTRLLVESRVNRAILNEAWHQGLSQKRNERSNPESIVGTIPAEESDAEFAAQVEAIS